MLKHRHCAKYTHRKTLARVRSFDSFSAKFGCGRIQTHLQHKCDGIKSFSTEFKRFGVVPFPCNARVYACGPAVRIAAAHVCVSRRVEQRKRPANRSSALLVLSRRLSSSKSSFEKSVLRKFSAILCDFSNNQKRPPNLLLNSILTFKQTQTN